MEFLFDDRWIDRKAGVRRVLGTPAKEPEPVLIADRPWEAGGIRVRQALHFDSHAGRFALWYTAQTAPDAESKGRFLCHAASTDGLSWERPDLGRYEFAGDRQNNIFGEMGDADGALFNIVHDPDDPDSTRLYKAIGYDYCATSAIPGIAPRTMGLCVSYSPDGFAWTPPKLVMTGQDLTDADCLLPRRDPDTGTWVGFFRPRTHPKRRFVGISTSDDFERWTYPRMLLAPTAEDDEWTEFYGLTATCIAGWRVGCLWVFHNNPEYSPMTTELVFCRNATEYRRAAPRQEFLPLGGPGSFDSRMVIPVAVIERGDEILLFYEGHNRDHGSDRGQKMPPGRNAAGEEPRSALGLARLPWGHFSGLRADNEGVVETTWLCNYGESGVRAVAAVDPDGSVLAELLDQYGQPIPGWGRDECRLVAGERGILYFAWGAANLAGASGEKSAGGGTVGHVVKVRFHLRRATLFGFAVGES